MNDTDLMQSHSLLARIKAIHFLLFIHELTEEQREARGHIERAMRYLRSQLPNLEQRFAAVEIGSMIADSYINGYEFGASKVLAKYAASINN